MVYLANNKSWKNLESLNLGYKSIKSDSIRNILQNTTWARLKNLNLARNSIDLNGIIELAKDNVKCNLNQLDLSENPINFNQTEVQDIFSGFKHTRIIF